MTDEAGNERTPGGDRFEVTISGDVSGQVAVGKGITQHQIQAALTPEFVSEMRERLEGLRESVAAEAPPELAPEALERLDEIEAAISEEGDSEDLPGKLERARDWFLKHLPTMAGTVSSVVINPIVGRLVETAGTAAARAVGKRLGLPETEL